MTRRHSITDSQWQAIQDKIPGKPGDPGRTGNNNRLLIDAVVFVAKTGIPWADLRERFGKPNSILKRFDRWAAKGGWTQLNDILGVPELAELQLDSTSIKAQGRRVRFFRVTELITQLLEAKEERQLLRYRLILSKLDLLILDDLGYVPASKAGRNSCST